MQNTLPSPSQEATLHSLALIRHIKDDILKHGGIIPFSRYMELALYAPALGYYSAGSHKIGKEGDFLTAPELSSLFAQCLAHQFQEILSHYREGVILELGAGSGKLASELLLYLQECGSLPKRYYILELSAELIARQKATLLATCPELLERVQWLSALPQSPIEGIIFGNEVLDAMPVCRFVVENQSPRELGVKWTGERFALEKLARNHADLSSLAPLAASLPNGYVSEFNALLPAFIKSLSTCLKSGVMLWIDYGYGEKDYYNPARKNGTLRCYYRHGAFEDPFIYPGLTDITAHVNFTELAESAVSADLEFIGYTTQGAFLLGNNLAEFVQESDDPALVQQAKILSAPMHMGESFKVMALAENANFSLSGFGLMDISHQL